MVSVLFAPLNETASLIVTVPALTPAFAAGAAFKSILNCAVPPAAAVSGALGLSVVRLANSVFPPTTPLNTSLPAVFTVSACPFVAAASNVELKVTLPPALSAKIVFCCNVAAPL